MVALGEEGLKAHIKTIGLFNTKAKNVIALSQALIERHGGEVPEDLDSLQALPGVGRKTANVVMNCAFGAERSEEHTSELQSRQYLVCRLLLEKKKKNNIPIFCYTIHIVP